MGIWYILPVLFFLVPLVVLPLYAQPDHIAIQLSQTCMVMVTNGIPGCPSYEEILLLFPDTSNHLISGGFDYSEDGFFERQKGMAKRNHWKFYAFENGVILWVDPPGDMKDRARTIIIEPSIPIYKIGGQTISNYTHMTAHDRWENPNCSQVTISAKNWHFLLGDTVQYVEHHCDENHTNFDPIIYEKFTKSFQDITTSYKWKYDHWMIDAKANCKGICKEY